MLKKLFTNDKFFLTMVVCAVVGTLCFSTVRLIYWPTSSAFCVPLIIYAICIAVLYIAYCKHSKNVMKGMMGSLLMGQLVHAIFNFNAINYSIDKVFVYINLIIVLFLFINHYVINSEHRAMPSHIKANQIAALTYAVFCFVWDGYWLIQCERVVDIFAEIAAMVAFPAIAAVIVCVESRLDAYRLDREAAGWTEEAGYPEGYVHQKDR